jgi:hypothetical protein
MGIFRAFRRDDTPEIANLKADEAYTREITPDKPRRAEVPEAQL